MRSVAAEILAGLEPAERKAFLSELMENVRRLDGPDEESTLPPDA